jgi:hypothetical protein
MPAIIRGVKILFGIPGCADRLTELVLARGFAIQFKQHHVAKVTRAGYDGFWVVEETPIHFRLVPVQLVFLPDKHPPDFRPLIEFSQAIELPK